MKLNNLFAAAFALGLSYSGMALANSGEMSMHHHGGHHGHHGHKRQVVCTVRNARGMVFQARGPAFKRDEVKDRAMSKCYRAGSRVCYNTGCDKI